MLSFWETRRLADRVIRMLARRLVRIYSRSELKGLAIRSGGLASSTVSTFARVSRVVAGYEMVSCSPADAIRSLTVSLSSVMGWGSQCGMPDDSMVVGIVS